MNPRSRETEDNPLHAPEESLRIAADKAPEEVATPDYERPRLNLLVECRRTIIRHRRLILVMVGAGVIAGLLVQLPIQPVFRASTSIDVHSANGSSSSEPPISPGKTTGNIILETQMKLIKSDQTMTRAQQRLIDEPYPASPSRGDWLSRLQRVLHLGGKEGISFSDLLSETAKGVHVKPLGSTPLIEVSCDSWDPAFAARYCNALTAEFQSEDLENRGTQAKLTSDWLMRQAAEVQAKSAITERRLEAILGSSRSAPGQDGTNVDQERLRQLQMEVAMARADLMAKQAQIEVAQSGDPDSAAGPLDRAAYTASQTKLTGLQQRLKVMTTRFGESDSKAFHLRKEIEQVEIDMSNVRVANMQRLQKEFEAAKHREELLALSCQHLEASQPSVFQNGSEADRMRREIAIERQLYQALVQRAREAGFNSATQTSVVNVVEEAKEPGSATYPRRVPIVAAGLVIGSLAGLGLALFKDRNRAVLRMPGESKQLLGLEELGVIPSPIKDALLPLRKHPETLSHSGVKGQPAALQMARWDDDLSLVAEAYRNAMLSIMLASPKKQGRVYVVSSPGAGDGKSTVISNLGVALSKSRLRVLLIDGDLRKPSLHRTLSVPNGLGLRNILRGEVNLADLATSAYCKSTIFPNLCVIPAGRGREQVPELLHTSRFSDLMRHLSGEFDVILVDTPPMLHIADARILARQADGAILVLRCGTTTREDAMGARDVLIQDHVSILGTILNDFDPAKVGKYGYYKSYYAYQQESKTQGKLLANS
jgi:succinoglycan biosynthesis transport protein ExoP